VNQHGAEECGCAGAKARAAGRRVAAALVVSILAGLALAVVYWTGGQPQAEGVLLGLSLGGIGVAMVFWAKGFLPNDEVAEERGRVEPTEEEVAAFVAAFRGGGEAIGRRSLLAKLLVGAFGALGLAVLFPIRSLGPRPGKGLTFTDYRPGIRVVTEAGIPLRPEALPVGAVVTVWPEGYEKAPDSPTLLVRVEDEDLFSEGVVREWTVGGIVAYSKLCTHAGCPVGLYQQRERLLLCPCHQSTFDVLRGAKPVFGPAVRPLPQLPLGLDGEGFLIALGDFPEPVGAGFWDAL
jgi:ubiquinol-cytochrome c reductase iron-sulfur subunit